MFYKTNQIILLLLEEKKKNCLTYFYLGHFFLFYKINMLNSVLCISYINKNIMYYDARH